MVLGFQMLGGAASKGLIKKGAYLSSDVVVEIVVDHVGVHALAVLLLHQVVAVVAVALRRDFVVRSVLPAAVVTPGATSLQELRAHLPVNVSEFALITERARPILVHAGVAAVGGGLALLEGVHRGSVLCCGELDNHCSKSVILSWRGS